MPFVPTLPNFETACEIWIFDHLTGSQPTYVLLKDDGLCQPTTVDPRDLSQITSSVLPVANSDTHTNIKLNPCTYILLPKDDYITIRNQIDPGFLAEPSYPPAMIVIQDADDGFWYGYLVWGMDRRYPDFPNEHYQCIVQRVSQAMLAAATGKTTS